MVEILGGRLGKVVLEDYNKLVETEYDNSSALKVLSYRDDVVRGSNPFAVVLVNQILEKHGLRVATQADLENTIKLNETNQGGLNLRGYCEDTGLVLRKFEKKEDPNILKAPWVVNYYLADNLADQTKTHRTVMIPLNELKLKKDPEAEEKVSFKLKECAQIIPAPILDKNGYFSQDDVDYQTGLPMKFSENTFKRCLVKDQRPPGLSRLITNWDLCLDSSWYWHLRSSMPDGRIVVV